MEHHPVEIIDDKPQYSHHLIVWSFRDFSPNFLSDDKLRLKLHFSLSGDSSVEINSKFCACLTSCCSLMRDVYSCKKMRKEKKKVENPKSISSNESRSPQPSETYIKLKFSSLEERRRDGNEVDWSGLNDALCSRLSAEVNAEVKSHFKLVRRTHSRFIRWFVSYCETFEVLLWKHEFQLKAAKTSTN